MEENRPEINSRWEASARGAMGECIRELESAAIVCGGKTRRTHNVTFSANILL